jgi:hypothetical protein
LLAAVPVVAVAVELAVFYLVLLPRLLAPHTQLLLVAAVLRLSQLDLAVIVQFLV